MRMGGHSMKKHNLNFDEHISVVLMGLMLLITFSNVIARYVFSASLSFTEEFTTAMFVLLCMLGSAIAAKRGSHLGLGLFTGMMPDKVRRYVQCAGNLICAAFCAILGYQGIFMVITEYQLKQLTIAMQWPQWIYGSFIPIGAAVLVIRFVQAACLSLKPEKDEKKKDGEIA